jgi:hypothetical protein
MKAQIKANSKDVTEEDKLWCKIKTDLLVDECWRAKRFLLIYLDY